MGEHVVHPSGQPLPLGQRGRAQLRSARLVQTLVRPLLTHFSAGVPMPF